MSNHTERLSELRHKNFMDKSIVALLDTIKEIYNIKEDNEALKYLCKCLISLDVLDAMLERLDSIRRNESISYRKYNYAKIYSTTTY